MSPEDQAKVLEKCNRESSAFYAASRVWNDGIVLPEDTRGVNDYMPSLFNKHFIFVKLHLLNSLLRGSGSHDWVFRIKSRVCYIIVDWGTTECTQSLFGLVFYGLGLMGGNL